MGVPLGLEKSRGSDAVKAPSSVGGQVIYATERNLRLTDLPRPIRLRRAGPRGASASEEVLPSASSLEMPALSGAYPMPAVESTACERAPDGSVEPSLPAGVDDVSHGRRWPSKS